MSLSPWLLSGVGMLLGAPALAQSGAVAVAPLQIVDVQPRVEPLLFRLELGFSARELIGEPLLGASVEMELGRHFASVSVAGILRLEVGSGPYSLPYQVVTTGTQFWARLHPRLWVGSGPEIGALLLRFPYSERIQWSILLGGNVHLSVNLARAGRGQFSLGGRADVEFVTDEFISVSAVTVAGTLSLGYHL